MQALTMNHNKICIQQWYSTKCFYGTCSYHLPFKSLSEGLRDTATGNERTLNDAYTFNKKIINYSRKIIHLADTYSIDEIFLDPSVSIFLFLKREKSFTCLIYPTIFFKKKKKKLIFVSYHELTCGNK